MKHPIYWIGFSCLAATTLIPGALHAQDVQCNSRIEAWRDDNAQGYMRRGDRCEGTYEPRMTTGSWRITSFFRRVSAFDPDSVETVRLSWRSPADPRIPVARIFVMAESMKFREYYRMDTQRSPDTGSYDWDMVLLAPQELKAREVGFLAFALSGDKQIYLPLDVGRDALPREEGQYTLTVVPNVRLAAVRVSIASAQTPGEVPPQGRYLQTNEPVSGRFVTQQPIQIVISGLPSPGLYLAEIRATMTDEDNTELPLIRVFFYHAEG